MTNSTTFAVASKFYLDAIAHNSENIFFSPYNCLKASGTCTWIPEGGTAGGSCLKLHKAPRTSSFRNLVTWCQWSTHYLDLNFLFLVAGRGDVDKGKINFQQVQPLLVGLAFSPWSACSLLFREAFCISLPSFNLFLPVCQQHCLPVTIHKTRNENLLFRLSGNINKNTCLRYLKYIFFLFT